MKNTNCTPLLSPCISELSVTPETQLQKKASTTSGESGSVDSPTQSCDLQKVADNTDSLTADTQPCDAKMASQGPETPYIALCHSSDFSAVSSKDSDQSMAAVHPLWWGLPPNCDFSNWSFTSKKKKKKKKKVLCVD
eukprot:Platyproteum_vivax@DN11198_c0_g1_i1.p1